MIVSVKGRDALLAIVEQYGHDFSAVNISTCLNRCKRVC
jgi:hypothetical protein